MSDGLGSHASLLIAVFLFMLVMVYNEAKELLPISMQQSIQQVILWLAILAFIQWGIELIQMLKEKSEKPDCFGDFPEEPDSYDEYPPWLCKNCIYREECEKETFGKEASEK